MVNAEDLQKKIAAGLPGATVIVEDPFNDGTHLTARVYSPTFQGLTKVAQHRAVGRSLDSLREEGFAPVVALRSRRLGLDHSQVKVLAEINLERILATPDLSRDTSEMLSRLISA